MKYKTVSNLEEEAFRRLTGVKRRTFTKMTEVLTEANKVKKRKGGRSNKLCIEDMLLMALEYLNPNSGLEISVYKGLEGILEII